MTDSSLEKLIEAARSGVVEDLKTLIHSHPELVRERDETGATPLHYAAFGGHRDAVRVLVEAGADINATDARFGATPAGWAIEYLREMGGFLAVELNDFAWAIENGHAEWVGRFLKRFPALRDGRDTQGRPFREIAERSANAEVQALFEAPTSHNPQP
jgi:ankyrin repeat protein